jgi:hypothetical protein
VEFERLRCVALSLPRRKQFQQDRLAAAMATEHDLPFGTLSALQSYLAHQGENSVSAARQAVVLL